MYPHERSLVEKFEGRPFTILGVNSDAGRDRIRRICEEKQLTWPSFWDGGTTGGPIASRWNVSAWPTIYVLDDKGVIRARDVRGEPLEKVLDALVAEAEARAGKAEAGTGETGEPVEAGHGK